MKTRQSHGWAVLAAICLVGSGCVDEPTNPTGLQFHHRDGHSTTGGGSGPSSSITTVVFRAWSPNFGPDDRFIADRNEPYVDGENKVVAFVERQFVFGPDDAKGKPTKDPRRICLDFSNSADETPDPFGRPVCVDGGFRTVWHSNEPDGFGPMADGETIQAEARIIFHLDDGSGTEYKLGYFCPESRDDPTCENLLTVIRTGDSWTLEFFATQVAELSSHTGPEPFARMGFFHAPFQITVTKEPVQ